MTSASGAPEGFDVEARALQSMGTSQAPIYRMVARALDGMGVRGGVLVDVGCGNGQLWPHLRDRVDRIVGVDAVRYPGVPDDAEFQRVDLDTGRVDLPDDYADVVTAVETIEHLENPRAFLRELRRITRPGGVIVVTTPNQLSALNLLSLLLRKQHVHFQDVHYPAHITALLEVDLLRMARETGLDDARIDYSRSGRLPLTPLHYPKALASLFPRAASDNLVMTARKPRSPAS